MDPEISKIIRTQAPIVLAEIQKAKSILLHCHPSPDPDSVGSAMAMMFALEQLGKKVTVIRGDSEIPKGFGHFPGVTKIVNKAFSEVDPAEFDLFIVQDSGSLNMISRYKPITSIPIRSVVIDHHASNTSYGDVNIVEPTYPAVAQILYDLFMIWGIRLNEEIASNLFMGIYSDTGGFKYAGTTSRTFQIAGELLKHIPNFTDLISRMENSNSPMFIAFEALALSSVRTFLGGKLGFSVISHAALREKNIPLSEVRTDAIAPVLRSVEDWNVSGLITEIQPGEIKFNFRSKELKYDVSKLAVALGGGGHKFASGATMKGTIDQAVEMMVAKAKELYNL